MSETWEGESAKELVARDICPKCMGELDTGWECNKCGYDASHLVKADSAHARKGVREDGKL